MKKGNFVPPRAIAVIKLERENEKLKFSFNYCSKLSCNFTNVVAAINTKNVSFIYETKLQKIIKTG